jgi:regulator of cell morphogenesis and NO signaling
MCKDHEKTARALREICVLTNDFNPAGNAGIAALFARLRALVNDMHRHVHLENNVLCPRATELEKGVSYGPK